ncbi:hypothetical protein DUI87_02355 [Hirundo rustica rustica]|uniref:Uncharacterized protein n=1 Tax=Hirundo rustica rustica TaxID=333673 RepID=A0A3M0L7K4_HIRRU|nr:hypothetical protein DUI87_02355 [Hirundo rustica rustica]
MVSRVPIGAPQVAHAKTQVVLLEEVATQKQLEVQKPELAEDASRGETEAFAPHWLPLVAVWSSGEGAIAFLTRSVFKKTPRLMEAQALSGGE